MKPVFERLTHLIPDKMYLKLRFRSRMHTKLNLKNPQTYSEKLQWLKLYYHEPMLVNLVDKYEVKSWVAEKIGEEHIIPTIGVWDHFEDIDLNQLPNQFVLKCTHDSGGIVICHDKTSFDAGAAKKKLDRCLKRNYFWHSREWPYKYVKPRIIAEEMMVDESGYELKDYKLFCFDGKMRYLFIATDRSVANEETKFDFFDENFTHLPIKNGHDNSKRELKRPTGFEEMKQFAEILSKGFPEARVDFYDINGKVYFGEITFFHWGGLMPFEPKEWDRVFGENIVLPEKKK